MSNYELLTIERDLTTDQLKQQPPIYIQLTPFERSALESIARPVLNHITYCEQHDFYFLDQMHLDVNQEFHIGLYPEELDALRFLFTKITEVPL